MNTLEPDILLKPKLAFAGLGWIGRSRLQSAAESGVADIVLITDPSEDCVNQALGIVPKAKVVKSFDDAIADNSIHGVVIATPSGIHKQQAVAALESDKAVICQKPLGRTSEEVNKVLKAARKANR